MTTRLTSIELAEQFCIGPAVVEWGILASEWVDRLPSFWNKLRPAIAINPDAKTGDQRSERLATKHFTQSHIRVYS
ncbi:MAG: hypothetical protein HRT89_12785 [Lentisphaeria bacterium]|nr:hypothetical protein [Lentisphaeria bacterium]NQZ68934.1 hypothetical protein [Lentisphaeria bacterium]